MSFHIPFLTLLFLLLGLGAALFALISVLDGFAFLRAVRRTLRRKALFRGRALLLIPVRGMDPTLAESLEALLNQEYEDYRVVFITDEGDPVAGHLEELKGGLDAAVLQAEARQGCSGKIAALLTGLSQIDPEDEVVVFADSDIVPDRRWLRHLLAPLADARVAAVTGYRWYFPLGGGLGPGLQSAWNSAAANVMFRPRWAYLWGGSYAIRRTVLEELDIASRWQRVLSDDMVMTRTLKDQGHAVAFAPRATVGNYTGATWREVVRWTNRQACLALLYNPAMRRLTLPYALQIGSLILAAVAFALAPLGSLFLVAGVLLLAPTLLGLVKGGIRRHAFSLAMPAFRERFRHHRAWFYLGTFVLPFLMLHNVRRATRMSAFEWRGKVYRFTSPEEIVVETKQ